MDITRRAIDGISSTTQEYRPMLSNGVVNPYQIETPYGTEDITWLI
jgi:hypothetical protein